MRISEQDGRLSGRVLSNTTAEEKFNSSVDPAREKGQSLQISGGRYSVRDLDPVYEVPEDLCVPCAPHESDPGHTYQLARSLEEEKDEGPDPSYEPFPADLTRVPVPDDVLGSLDGLSGCAVRLCLLMIRASYSWAEDFEQFRASSRLFTASEIVDEAGGLGMSRESLRSAANELVERGWIEQRKRKGQAIAYRWSLSVPRSRYTPIPAPLLHAHQGLSHSALTLILSVFRATWGWTVKEDEEVKHKRSAELTTSDLEKMTGLSRPTVRDAQDELIGKNALTASRKHAGAPYRFAVDLSFFRARLQNSYTPTYREENSNKHTYAGENTSRDAHTKGESRGRADAYEVTQDWEEEAIRLLCADPIEMRPSVARDLVIRRAKSVVEGAVKAFRRRESEVDNPAGWMCSAVKNLWFGPSIENKSPDVQQSSAEAPLALAFEDLTEKSEGWEWDEDRDRNQTADGEGAPAGLDSEPTAGVTHSQMCQLIEDLGQPDSGWEPVERPGKSPLFVPTKELGNWAWRRRNQGGESFQNAAEWVVQLRKRYEEQ